VRTTPIWIALAPLLAFAWLTAGAAMALVRQWLSSPDASYGLALAGVAAAIAWQRRRRFISSLDGRSAPVAGVAALLAGFALHLAGSLGADLFLTRVSVVVLLVGMSCFLAGPAATRVMAPAFTFLLLAIPPPTLVVNAVTLPLQLVASQIAEASLMGAGIPVYRDGNLLQLSSTTLEVAEACSGLRSVVSLGALAVLFAWATPGGLAGRTALVASAVPVAVVTNGVRVALTGVASEVWGPHVVNSSWHSFTGWVTFVVSLAILMALRRMIPAPDTMPLMPEAVRA
jgi:exosortase